MSTFLDSFKKMSPTMMNLGQKHMPVILVSLILCGVFGIGWWSLFNSELQVTKQGGVASILEVQKPEIQNWIKESEVIWKKGIADRIAAASASKLDPRAPWVTVDGRNIWDFFYPTYNCPHTVERLGRLGDGGKWVCGISHFARKGHPCIVYSYGTAGDSSFEEEVLNRTNCFVYAYDPTVDPRHVALTKLYPLRSNFTKLGLGTEDKGLLRTLKTEMRRHGTDFIDILKMDVEGAEYSALPQILKDFPELPIGQLLVEVHLNVFPKNNLYRNLKRWWTALEAAGLRPFRAEPNLIALLNGGTRGRPLLYEISFVNIKTDHLLLHA